MLYWILDYVGFIMKMMKLMQNRYVEFRKIEVELKQLQETDKPPERPGKSIFVLFVSGPYILTSQVFIHLYLLFLCAMKNTAPRGVILISLSSNETCVETGLPKFLDTQYRLCVSFSCPLL